MIDVLVGTEQAPRCGGEAEAETPEGALLAARTLCAEYLEANRHVSRSHLRAIFLAEGEHVRTVSGKELC